MIQGLILMRIGAILTRGPFQPSSACRNRSFSTDSFAREASAKIPAAVRDGSPEPTATRIAVSNQRVPFGTFCCRQTGNGRQIPILDLGPGSRA